MAKDTITIRTDTEVTGYLEKNFTSKSAGAIIAVESFLCLRKACIMELKGVFTKMELLGLIDALQGSKLIPEYQVNTNTFVFQLIDINTMQKTFSKFDVIFNKLIDKIQKLTAAQVFFIQCEIHCLTNKENYPDQIIDFLIQFI